MSRFAPGRSSQLAAALLWLLLALLPLRGLAQAWMLAAAPSPAAGPVAAAVIASVAAAAPACHEPAAPLHHAAPAAEADGVSGDHAAAASHTTCGLCDLCHGASLPGAWLPMAVFGLPEQTVLAAVEASTTAPLVDGPFKPPRG